MVACTLPAISQSDEGEYPIPLDLKCPSQDVGGWFYSPTAPIPARFNLIRLSPSDLSRQCGPSPYMGFHIEACSFVFFSAFKTIGVIYHINPMTPTRLHHEFCHFKGWKHE